MSHLDFSILAFSTKVWPIKTELLSIQNVNIAHFARNVEWDFFCDFQTPCIPQAPCQRRYQTSFSVWPEENIKTNNNSIHCDNWSGKALLKSGLTALGWTSKKGFSSRMIGWLLNSWWVRLARTDICTRPTLQSLGIKKIMSSPSLWWSTSETTY